MSDLDELYPEHKKLMAIADKSRAIGQFIYWLEEEKDLYLMRQPDEDQEFLLSHVYRTESITDLLAEYFEIDQQKIEAEKQAMFEAMRSMP